ncbi:MAG: chemotaxis protein CheW [Planctomycetota bacterium]
MNDTRQFCTFSLGDQYFGIDVLQVREIVRPQPITIVPLTPPAIRGLINLRGQIVTAIDTRLRLNLAPRSTPLTTTTAEQLNVVVNTAEGSMSLLVDEIGDVLTLDDHDFEPPPRTLSASAREMILGTYKLSDRLLIILDVEQLARIPAQT